MDDEKEMDPFGPPKVPVLVACLHCGEEYDSSLIEWRRVIVGQGRIQGFWCCPIAECGGVGFGFDILPVDPNYRDERGGWVFEEESDGFSEENDTDTANH
jgi:hypothetical protein